MSDVAWTDVVAKIARRCGLGATPTTERAAQLSEFALDRLVTAWGWAWWPNATVVQAVPYRPLWDDTKQYVKGDEVWDGTTNYYRAKDDNDLSLTTDVWELLSKLDPVLPWDNAGTVEGVYFSEAEARRRLRRIGYEVRAGKLYLLTDSGPKLPWVRFRMPVPDVTKVVTEGETAPGVLAELVPYIVEGAEADYLRFEGKNDSADRREGLALEKLTLAAIMQLDQQGETPKTEVVAGGTERPGKNYGPRL